MLVTPRSTTQPRGAGDHRGLRLVGFQIRPHVYSNDFLRHESGEEERAALSEPPWVRTVHRRSARRPLAFPTRTVVTLSEQAPRLIRACSQSIIDHFSSRSVAESFAGLDVASGAERSGHSSAQSGCCGAAPVAPFSRNMSRMYGRAMRHA
jgi:hypothetical protein